MGGEGLKEKGNTTTCQASISGLVPGGLWVAIDVEGLLSEDAHNGQHCAAAMLQLGLPEPLDVGICHVAVEVEVPGQNN